MEIIHNSYRTTCVCCKKCKLYYDIKMLLKWTRHIRLFARLHEVASITLWHTWLSADNSLNMCMNFVFCIAVAEKTEYIFNCICATHTFCCCCCNEYIILSTKNGNECKRMPLYCLRWFCIFCPFSFSSYLNLLDCMWNVISGTFSVRQNLNDWNSGNGKCSVSSSVNSVFSFEMKSEKKITLIAPFGNAFKEFCMLIFISLLLPLLLFAFNLKEICMAYSYSRWTHTIKVECEKSALVGRQVFKAMWVCLCVRARARSTHSYTQLSESKVVVSQRCQYATSA